MQLRSRVVSQPVEEKAVEPEPQPEPEREPEVEEAAESEVEDAAEPEVEEVAQPEIKEDDKIEMKEAVEPKSKEVNKSKDKPTPKPAIVETVESDEDEMVESGVDKPVNSDADDDSESDIVIESDDDEEDVDSDAEMDVDTNGKEAKQPVEEETKDKPKIESEKEIKHELRGHRLPLTCVCLDASDKYAYTASKDGSIIKWCLTTRKILNKVNSIRKKEAQSNKKLEERCHVNHINAIAISDDSKFLATGGWDKKVRIWSPDDLSWLHTFTLHRQEITALAFRRGHHMLYSGSADRSVMLWTLEEDDNRCFVESLIGHESPITSMDTTRKERVLTSGGLDQTIRIWKIVEQAQTVFQSKHQSVDVAKFINDQLFVSGGEDGNIILWTTMKRSPLCSMKAHDTDKKSNLSFWITSLATFYQKPVKKTMLPLDVNPTKRRKVDDDAMDAQDDDSDDDDDKERSDDENMNAVKENEQDDAAIALIASGSCDSKLKIWKLIKSNLELHQTIECPGYINDLKFTSDGKRIVAACGKEHRFGRWTVSKGVKNCWKVFEVNKL